MGHDRWEHTGLYYFTSVEVCLISVIGHNAAVYFATVYFAISYFNVLGGWFFRERGLYLLVVGVGICLRGGKVRVAK